ncbi:GTPase [Nocardioides sp.]|uniref:GTPase n=1 Tax=Nocardioides sp. TaxID=35761 RepID=UPI003512D747
MTDQPVSTTPPRTWGAEMGARVAALEAAVAAGQGRLDAALIEDVRGAIDRASGRLRLSAQHTVVAIAGATGSGKSSTFNALNGLELSSTGVRRPTTSWATACVWGSEGAEELLSWLGIPPRHQTMRESMLDTQVADRELDGVVLLDLPDHDSTEVAHHLEVDRLVELADLLVWVLDPQKYADAAIHDRYLAPLRTHAGVMLVVLNHIDSVPVDRRQAMVDDVRRLLDLDGLTDVPVFPISATEGTGVTALRAEIVNRVAAKRQTRDKMMADLRAVALRLAEATGDGTPRDLGPVQVEAVVSAVGDAAGVATLGAAVESAARRRVARAVAWPPLRALAGRGGESDELADRLSSLGRGESLAVPPVARERVLAAARTLGDDTAAGLAAPWADAVGSAALRGGEALTTRLDADLPAVDLRATALPGWAGAVRALQWLLLLGAVGGLGWTGYAAVDGSLGDVAVAGAPAPVVLLVVCLVVGLVLGVAARAKVAAAATAAREEAESALTDAVRTAARESLITPVGQELAAHAAVRRALAPALA